MAAVFIGSGSTVSITDSNFSNNYQEVANSSSVSTALVHSGVSDLTIKDSIFSSNTSYSVYSSATSSTGVSGSVIKMFVGNRGGSNKGNLLVENVLFDSNQSISEYQAFGNVYLTNPNTATFRDSTFRNNLTGGVEAGSINGMGGAIAGYGIGDTIIENSTFEGNTATSAYRARGGAVFANTEYAVWKDNKVSLNIRNSNFTGNSAVQLETDRTSSMDANVWAAGGALYLSKTAVPTFQVEIADSTFTGNFASVEGLAGNIGNGDIGGGAIYTQNSDIKISATKNITNVGNYVEVLGEKLNSKDGYLYMNGGSTEFAIAENAVMTIGDGRVGYDSIASMNSTSTISKTGAGRMVVNSSMEHFSGTLNVNEGMFDARGKVGASAINISEGAILALTIKGNNILSNDALTLSNDGRINLVAGNGVRGDYTVAASSGVNFGEVKAYGGTFADNVFSVQFADEIRMGSTENAPIAITENAVISIVDDATSQPLFEMAFNLGSGNITINSISDTTSSLADVIPDVYKYVSAYAFDVLMGDGDTVYLSFLVGDQTLNIGDFSVFHRENNGTWAIASTINDMAYDGEYLSFAVSHFSEYGFAAIPEPSIYAALLGLTALAFVMYRRRK